MNNTSSTSIDIRPMQGRKALNHFLNVPFALYADDPQWVAPLHLERRQALSPQAPFFKHARWQAWTAYRGTTPIARISAQIDDLHAVQQGEQAGYFGLFECPDDPNLAAQLFSTAEAWLKSQGCTRSIGPFNLGINQELGTLIEGFETPPYYMMPHGRPYYDSLIQSCNYDGVQDLLAYVMDPAFEIPPVMQKLLKRLAPKINLRAVNRRRLDEDLSCLRDIFNDAWSQNWGFVPFTEEEFNAIGKEMLLLIPDEFIQIAELDGEPVAFIVLLPNINEAIADLGGRLLPFGWAKVLWRLKVKSPTTGRVPLMGVRRRLHHTRMGPGIAFTVINAIRTAAMNAGMKEVEMSWILADNTGMCNIIENIGGTTSKRYRMYSKALL